MQTFTFELGLSLADHRGKPPGVDVCLQEESHEIEHRNYSIVAEDEMDALDLAVRWALDAGIATDAHMPIGLWPATRRQACNVTSQRLITRKG